MTLPCPKGSFGNAIQSAQFVIEQRNGRWIPRGTIYMRPMRMELHPVDWQQLSCTVLLTMPQCKLAERS
jgi:hypothetical protein